MEPTSFLVGFARRRSWSWAWSNSSPCCFRFHLRNGHSNFDRTLRCNHRWWTRPPTRRFHHCVIGGAKGDIDDCHRCRTRLLALNRDSLPPVPKGRLSGQRRRRYGSRDSRQSGNVRWHHRRNCVARPPSGSNSACAHTRGCCRNRCGRDDSRCAHIASSLVWIGWSQDRQFPIPLRL